MSRADQSTCSLVVDGQAAPITFSKRGGGMADSEESKYPPGGMLPEESLGGRQVVENATLTGEYKPEVHGAYIKFLESRRGKGNAIVTEQALDRDGNAFGAQQTWRGILKSVNTGEYDSTSADAREVEIEVSTHGTKT